MGGGRRGGGSGRSCLSDRRRGLCCLIRLHVAIAMLLIPLHLVLVIITAPLLTTSVECLRADISQPIAEIESRHSEADREQAHKSAIYRSPNSLLDSRFALHASVL